MCHNKECLLVFTLLIREDERFHKGLTSSFLPDLFFFFPLRISVCSNFLPKERLIRCLSGKDLPLKINSWHVLLDLNLLFPPVHIVR